MGSDGSRESIESNGDWGLVEVSNNDPSKIVFPITKSIICKKATNLVSLNSDSHELC